MVAIPILNGITADGADFKTSFPVNLIPVPKSTGLSEGFLRPAEGIVTIVDTGGANRGGYYWRGAHYRVQGNNLIRVASDGTITNFGTIAGGDWCGFDESFDYLAINGGGKLYYFNGTTLTQVTDVDLGNSLDMVWVNGYFVSTDGQFLVSSDINNPFSFNPLRYTSSEISPDPVVALQKLRNEIYAVNRYTIEVFGALANPGSGFPFGRIEGAQIMKGAVGSRAVCEFSQSLAFVGSGDNQPPSVWIAQAGNATKLSTRDIDDELRKYTDIQLATVVLESRQDRGHEFLYVHLQDKTLVFDAAASQVAQQPIWFVLQSNGGYRARGFVWAYGQWNVADPFGTKIGKLSDDIGSHYGDNVKWQFDTPIVYNESSGAIIHELELVALTGNVALTDDPLLATSFSEDGVTFSAPRYIRAGRIGERQRRLLWTRQGAFKNWRTQRFQGDTRANLSFARLEAKMEPLQW